MDYEQYRRVLDYILPVIIVFLRELQTLSNKINNDKSIIARLHTSNEYNSSNEINLYDLKTYIKKNNLLYVLLWLKNSLSLIDKFSLSEDVILKLVEKQSKFNKIYFENLSECNEKTTNIKQWINCLKNVINDVMCVSWNNKPVEFNQIFYYIIRKCLVFFSILLGA